MPPTPPALDVPPINFQPRRPINYRPRPAAAAPVVLAPPVLIAASCDESPMLTLTFDRPVDVSAMDVTALRVDNALLTSSYVGWQTPTLASPTTVQVMLSGTGDYSGPGVILNAAAGNGIVAAGGGGGVVATPWTGATDLSLPMGQE